ncbi:MAG: insulinase family protein [Armatimonadetes bacterium]|nr:insulinase family protein [Armatimonadota bacterium]
MQPARRLSIVAPWLCVSLAWTLAHASAAILDPRTVQSEVLNNGLRLIVSTDAQATVTAVEVVVKVGSANEPVGQRGIAHLLEHVLWASAPRADFDPRLAIESVGGVLDAQTLRDYTRFYATVPAGHLDTAVEALSSIVLCQSLPDAIIAREQRIVIEESAARSEDPKAVLEDEAFTQVYTPDHPYANPVDGYPDELLALDEARLSLFHQTWYLPNNMAVVVSGDVTFQQAREAIVRAFGHLPPAPVPTRITPTLSRPREGVEHSRELPIERAYVMAAYLGPPGSERRQVCATDVLATLLTHDTQGCLVHALREQTGLALQVGVDFLTQHDRALFGIWVVCDPANIEAVQRVIREQLADIARGSVRPPELAAAKRLLSAGYAFANETPADRATTLGFYEAIDSYLTACYYLAWANAMGSDDVAEIAQWYAGDPVWIILRPETCR